MAERKEIHKEITLKCLLKNNTVAGLHKTWCGWEKAETA